MVLCGELCAKVWTLGFLEMRIFYLFMNLKMLE